MLQKQLPNYQNLPVISPDDAVLLQPTILYYDELIVNIKNFVHPGTQIMLTPYLGKDISQIFHIKQHSLNAKLMLINLTFGRRSLKQGKGYKLLQQLKNQKISIIHEKVMSSIDLSHGVLKQVSRLSKEQIQAFVSIPKYYQNPSSIMFTQSKLDQFLYLDRFWVSTTVFISVVLGIFAYMRSNDALFSSSYRILLFLLGMFIWTMIEYYFHRVLLHTPIKSGMIINPHYVHHAFPNLPNKLSLSICRNLFIEFCVFLMLITTNMLQKYDALHLIVGFQTFLTLYDILHYYFHFGPELNLPVISYLKKNHMKHHFRNSNRGFGVTNLFWDWVFGTMHVK